MYRPALNDLVIEVRIRANPKPTLTWFRDGLAIDQWKQYEKYQILNTEEPNHVMNCKLIISNPNQYRDVGKYILIAQNRVATLELLHMLEFEGRKVEHKRHRMDEVFVINEVPRVNPK